jgi:hypothetical protein
VGVKPATGRVLTEMDWYQVASVGGMQCAGAEVDLSSAKRIPKPGHIRTHPNTAKNEADPTR